MVLGIHKSNINMVRDIFQEKEIPKGSWNSATVEKWEDRWSNL